MDSENVFSGVAEDNRPIALLHFENVVVLTISARNGFRFAGLTPRQSR